MAKILKSGGLICGESHCINPFVPNAPLLYHLKTSENLTVFWCFQGVEKECIGNKWVKIYISLSAGGILGGTYGIECRIRLTYHLHCVKSVRIRGYSGPYFPPLVLNTVRLGKGCIGNKWIKTVKDVFRRVEILLRSFSCQFTISESSHVCINPFCVNAPIYFILFASMWTCEHRPMWSNFKKRL